MKNKMNLLLVLLLSACFFAPSFAQQKKAPNFKEGVIKYKVEVDGMPEVSQFINGSIINLVMKEKNSKMDISIMGGMASFQLINNKKDDLFTLLMDVPAFYEKTAISIDEDSDLMKTLNEAKSKNQAPEKDLEVKYFKGKKKKIAKYSCYKAEVSMDGTSDKLIVYLTDKLRPMALSQLEQSIGELDGFPLGFEMEIEGVMVKVMAQEVSKETIEGTAFSVPDTYAMKSLDEFKEEIEKQFGGAGGGGIGL